jgi:hypothetical protein
MARRRGYGSLELCFENEKELYAALGDTPSALQLLQETIKHNFYCHACFVRDGWQFLPDIQKCRNEANLETDCSLIKSAKG